MIWPGRVSTSTICRLMNLFFLLAALLGWCAFSFAFLLLWAFFTSDHDEDDPKH